MGDIAEMMLDGTLCQGCGVFIGLDYPWHCPDCENENLTLWRAAKVKCKVCGKKVKDRGINDHMRDAHGETPNDEVSSGVTNPDKSA